MCLKIKRKNKNAHYRCFNRYSKVAEDCIMNSFPVKSYLGVFYQMVLLSVKPKAALFNNICGIQKKKGWEEVQMRTRRGS